jgi:arylsulfatase B
MLPTDIFPPTSDPAKGNVMPKVLIRLLAALAVPLAVINLLDAANAAAPNVILVITDDQGYGDFGCHGNPILKTPHLDALYSQSLRFTDFHATPLCSTTRAGLMTGRCALRTGEWSVVGGHTQLRANEVTLAQAFAASGYRTGIFGKWHLGDSYPFRPQDRGFHEVLVHGGGGIGTTPDYWGNDYFDDTFFRNGRPEKLAGHGTVALFNAAMQFVETSQDRPFFCYLPIDAPHNPWNVEERYSAPYRDKVPAQTANFYGMIAQIDEQIGRLVQRLDALGLAESTLLVFMTDNGSSGGSRVFNAGMRGGKGGPYEGGHRVPCWLRWPGGGIARGRDAPQLAAQLDLFPTLVELCGLKLPRAVAFDGLSLVPLLRGKPESWPDRTLFIDTHQSETPVKWNNTCALRGRWRLVDGRELYDLARDPGQERDVAGDHPQIVAELRAAYDAWWTEIEPSFSDQPHFVAGTPHEDPLWLNTWDLHGQSVYLQNQVEQCDRADGWWSVEFAAAGDYEITLRRWPRELDRPINEGLVTARVRRGSGDGPPIKGATLARLTVAGRDLQQAFESGAREVVFKVKVPAGKTRLQAWFINDDVLGGATWGAYYVGIKRL